MTIVRGVVCPECGGPIVYNGNYYCQCLEDTGSRSCWAMDADVPTLNDLVINRTYLLQRLEDPRDDADEARLKFYLANVLHDIEAMVAKNERTAEVLDHVKRNFRTRKH